MQPPFWILVPGGYKTYFAEGQPSVAEFAFPTEVKVDTAYSNNWFMASNVKGFPAGRAVLFYGPDVGVKLRLVQRVESTKESVGKILGEAQLGAKRLKKRNIVYVTVMQGERHRAEEELEYYGAILSQGYGDSSGSTEWVFEYETDLSKSEIHNTLSTVGIKWSKVDY